MKTVQALPSLVSLLIPGICIAQPVKQIYPKIKNKEITMSAIQNKEIVRNLYEEVLNKRNFESLQNIVSGEYIGVSGNKGVQAIEGTVLELIKAFPDINWKIENLLAEDDKVMVSWKWAGTHNGPFQNFAATGKAVTNDGIGVYTLKNGKITNGIIQTNRLGFLQELGVVPVDISKLLEKKNNPSQVFFIDKFIVPAKAKEEFINRANYNRAFIKNLPGFVGDNAYESLDANGNVLITTIAVWEDEAALSKAKEAVQAEYKHIGFDPVEMTKRLGITLDRAIYKALD
jgi:steroid delta-isomerase-like uncharacterized protein